MTAEQLSTNLESVRERIASACARAARDPAEVEILAVSKTVAPERLVAAVRAGLTAFGENRVQEAEAKVSLVESASWHLVGHLQSNKAARGVVIFDSIHSIDSLPLAERVGRFAGETKRAPYPVFLQVNVDADPAKEGFSAEDLLRNAESLAAIPTLRIKGLMTVGRLTAHPEEARPTFRALRELSQRVRSTTPSIGTGLSMGMSDDFEVAVEEGATIVRLGRVIFGERPAA